MIRLRRSAAHSTLFLIVLFVSFVPYETTVAQDSCAAPFQVMKQKKVTNITIPGTDIIHGYLERLPDDYNTTTQHYPLLIFIHGINETGSGSSADLCKLLGEWWWTPSTLAERTSDPVFPVSVTDPNGQSYKFISISAQLVYFGDANSAINALITYLSNRYRVDASRVYLTGLSAGANFIEGYVSASVANANRVAAILPVAPCDGLTTQGAINVAQANLPVWAIQCSTDNMCNGATAQNIANNINSRNPAAAARAHATTLPVANWPCNPFPHDVWGTAYNQAFRQTDISGRNVNAYEWMIQFSRSALMPVKLENYSVQLKEGKAYVRWTTSAENNNARFNIERSADGRKFSEIAAIPAVGNTTGKTYQWIDERPLANLSYYRLSQTDLNGRTENFQIKKIMNRSMLDRSLIIAPNPFTTELAAYINVSRTQQVAISITDISGRVLKTINGKYAEGAAEINMNTTDLPKGIYILKVKGEDFTQTQKIIKQ